MPRLPGTKRTRFLVGLACGVVIVATVLGLAGRDRPPDLREAAKPGVTVLKVVGASARTAIRKLRSRSLGSEFTVLGLNNSCVGLPSTGRIVRQKPQWGVRLSRKGSVKLQTSCPEQLPPCQPYQLALRAVGTESGFPGTSGERIIYAKLTHIAGVPCEVDSTASLVVRASDGALAPIRGNPASVPLHQRTGLGEVVELGWFLGGRAELKQALIANVQVGAWSATAKLKSPDGNYARPPYLDFGLHVSTGWFTTPRSYRAAVVTTRAYGE